MRVHLGSDHAGLELKTQLIQWLAEHEYEVIDHGPSSFDADDDYPGYCFACAEAVAQDADSLGVVIGGSGNGEQMAANLVDGVRAALVWSQDIARLAREHNNANVISLGARMHPVEECQDFLRVFLETPFSQESRHSRRLAQMRDYENSRSH